MQKCCLHNHNEFERYFCVGWPFHNVELVGLHIQSLQDFTIFFFVIFAIKMTDFVVVISKNV